MAPIKVDLIIPLHWQNNSFCRNISLRFNDLVLHYFGMYILSRNMMSTTLGRLASMPTCTHVECTRKLHTVKVGNSEMDACMHGLVGGWVGLLVEGR